MSDTQALLRLRDDDRKGLASEMSRTGPDKNMRRMLRYVITHSEGVLRTHTRSGSPAGLSVRLSRTFGE